MKVKVSAIILLSFIVIFSLYSQPPGHEKMMKELKLNDQQQDQFDKMKFETKKKMIEMRAKVATSKLELRHLMDAEMIDKSAIEKKMNEVAATEVAIRMNHLNTWIELNKVLTPEQQKIWKKALKFRPEQMMKRKMMMHGEMNERMQPPMKYEHEMNHERKMKN